MMYQKRAYVGKQKRKENGKKEENVRNITARDEQILHLLYHNRCMKTEQIAECVFKYNNGKENTHYKRIAQRRLKALHDLGLVKRFYYLQETGSSGFYYVLEKKGAIHLASVLNVSLSDLNWKREINQKSVAYLEHSSQISDVYIAFLNYQRTHQGHDIDTYQAENHLRHEFIVGKAKAVFNPDAYLRYFTSIDGMHCFIELDQGTDNPKNLLNKLKRYRLFYTTGAYKTKYENFPFVCFIVPNKKRKQKILSLLQEHDRSEIQWLLKTKEELMGNPLKDWCNKTNQLVNLCET